MGDSSDEELLSADPQTSFHVATNSVLSTLRNIRTTPQLRQNFVVGYQDNAMREVQRSFRSKKKGQSKKKEAKRKKKYFKHTIACRAHVQVCEWDLHLCKGVELYADSTREPSPTPSEVLAMDLPIDMAALISSGEDSGGEGLSSAQVSTARLTEQVQTTSHQHEQHMSTTRQAEQVPVARHQRQQVPSIRQGKQVPAATYQGQQVSESRLGVQLSAYRQVVPVSTHQERQTSAKRMGRRESAARGQGPSVSATRHQERQVAKHQGSVGRHQGVLVSAASTRHQKKRVSEDRHGLAMSQSEQFPAARGQEIQVPVAIQQRDQVAATVYQRSSTSRHPGEQNSSIQHQLVSATRQQFQPFPTTNVESLPNETIPSSSERDQLAESEDCGVEGWRELQGGGGMEENIVCVPTSGEENVVDLTSSTIEPQCSLSPWEYDEWKKVRQEQDRLFQESLLIDQDKEQRLKEEATKAIEAQRMNKWREEIRGDLKSMVPPEPDEKDNSNLKMKFKFPNGMQVCRRFSPSSTVKELLGFVGSNDSVLDPRSFTLKVANSVPPIEFRYSSITQKLNELDLDPLTVFYVQNSDHTHDNLCSGSQAGINVFDELEHPQTQVDVLDVAADVLVVAVTQTHKDSEKHNFLQRRKILFEQTISKPPYKIEVHRNNVTAVLLSEYGLENVEKLMANSLCVVFEDEEANDLSGLTREVFAIFYKKIQEEYFDGNVDCVPRVDPQTCRNTMFTTIGRIISHSFVLTKMFPVFISQAAMQSVLVCHPDDELLISSFLNYIDDFEKDSLTKVMNGNSTEEDDENALGVISRCQSNTLPTKESIRGMIINAAKSELVCRPTHALQAIHNGMVSAHPDLWHGVTKEELKKLYDDLIPTHRSVWQLIATEEGHTLSRQEEKIMDYLRRLIFSLSQELLGIFLRFITGSPYIGSNIKVGFNAQDAGFLRRPMVNTCSPHLHLPTSYASFSEFKNEFLSILNHSSEWFMDLQ